MVDARQPIRAGGADARMALFRARSDALELIRDLQSDAAAIASSTADGPDDEHDPEGPTLGYERARVAALLENARGALRAIEEAIARAESGGYGRCEACGRAIAAERLAAIPAARWCTSCARGRRLQGRLRG
ncbi:MAG TPA: TraR/DksA C4-type zinc finger protein [Acidimicrobiales bacterium]|nr:TraR/DksA C4-type zinc finger protein [Acidimicrobiales bacterium]